MMPVNSTAGLNATIVEKKIILKFLAIINEFLLMTVVVLITHAYCISYYSTLAPREHMQQNDIWLFI